MDFGYHEGESNGLPIHAPVSTPSHQPAEIGFSEMLDRIERLIDADPALRGVFSARFANRFAEAVKAKIKLEPLPDDLGTVELSIWDNQPQGKRVKVEGDNSREKPARYALAIRACKKGHSKPLTTTPDFSANVGDLFTPDQVRARLKRAWKGMEEDELEFLNEHILPAAEAQSCLVARLSRKLSARDGGGTHFYEFHYALVPEQELFDRKVERVLIIVKDRILMLPPCSPLDAKGKPFKIVTRTTKAGANRDSIVLGQSRATDHTTAGMKAWATGEITRP